MQGAWMDLAVTRSTVVFYFNDKDGHRHCFREHMHVISKDYL